MTDRAHRNRLAMLRARRYRKRQKRGERIAGVPITDAHTEALIDAGRLDIEKSEDLGYVGEAIGRLIDDLARLRR